MGNVSNDRCSERPIQAKVVLRLPSFLCGLFAYRYDLIADRRTADSKQFGGLAVPHSGDSAAVTWCT